MPEFHAPGWHGKHRTPVVDGRYYDRETGQVKTYTAATVAGADASSIADEPQEYMGPPAVDIFVMSIHDYTSSCMFRAARAFPMEELLASIMTTVSKRRLALDSVIATTYSIRVILADKSLTPETFNDVALEFAYANDE